MKEFKYVITDPEGIHARPAGELVKAAKEFQSVITLTKDGKTGDCKRIFGIMGLAVKAGNEITLTFDGEDEEAAYAAVTEFVSGCPYQISGTAEKACREHGRYHGRKRYRNMRASKCAGEDLSDRKF